jgi:hypothetical protein
VADHEGHEFFLSVRKKVLAVKPNCRYLCSVAATRTRR